MAVIMLRFNTAKPKRSSLTYAHYREIAQVLNLTYNEVQHICRAALLPPRPMSIEKKIH